MSVPDLPASATVVVIGGGVMGLSTAYHLAAAGVPDVVLIEKGELGGGSTSRAAGGVRALFSDEVNIRLGRRSLETFHRFGTDFGQEIDLHVSGYLFLLDDEEQVASFSAAAQLQNALGVPSRIIGVEEAKRLSPLISTEGLVAALWSPEDGHCTPEAVVAGYARAARRLGVRIVTGCAATGITHEGGVIAAVETDRGPVRTGGVICTAGAWSATVGSWVGADLPITPLRRQIAVTEAIEGLDPHTPFTIDFATSFYFHREGPGLLLGAPEQDDVHTFDHTPTQAWLGDLAEAMEQRVPALGDIGLRRGWAGLYEMTPDHNAVIGEHPGVSRFLYCAGFSGHGFLMGPAMGEVMRDLYLGVTPEIDVSTLSAERFASAGRRPELNIV